MPSALAAFLSRNSVNAAQGLPLVHTTQSYNLKAIMAGDEIKTQPCDVFTDDSLTYFFVGRPAYKYESKNSSAEAWELPCCFIFESDTLSPMKRIFPFDSGAFAGGRYPSYINKMPLAEFEVNSLDAPEKIIGAFFGNASRYFDLTPKSRDDVDAEFSLTPLDAEISAASRLAGEATPNSFDDRRFTIEMQYDKNVDLVSSKIIAVILPESYLDVKEIRDKIEMEWDAEPIGYPMYPLSVSMYHALIYKEVKDLYVRRGLL